MYIKFLQETEDELKVEKAKNATARKNEIKTGTAHDVAKKNGWVSKQYVLT